MAVLGAKRPQDRGWQWVVLSLWIVLVWPAAQAVLLPAGIRVELFVAWKLFLWGLIGIGLLNYLPTKNWLAAIFVAAGQAILLRNHLWLGNSLNNEWASTLGIGCLLTAALLITWQNKSKNKKQPRLYESPERNSNSNSNSNSNPKQSSLPRNPMANFPKRLRRILGTKNPRHGEPNRRATRLAPAPALVGF